MVLLDFVVTRLIWYSRPEWLLKIRGSLRTHGYSVNVILSLLLVTHTQWYSHLIWLLFCNDTLPDRGYLHDNGYSLSSWLLIPFGTILLSWLLTAIGTLPNSGSSRYLVLSKRMGTCGYWYSS